MRHAAFEFRWNIRHKYRALGFGAFILRISVVWSIVNDAPGNCSQRRPCAFDTVHAAPGNVAKLPLPVTSRGSSDLVDHQDLHAPVRAVFAINLAAYAKVR